MERFIDLGAGHNLRLALHGKGITRANPEGLGPEVTESPYGFIETHPRPDNGEPCSGMVCVCDKKGHGHDDHPSWKMEREQPITLSPSVLCTACGNHGFIRDGKWVKA